jgi:hypothetical protein
MIVSERTFAHLSFDELKALADQVGVGYMNTDEEGLRERLRFEGAAT